MEPVYQRVPFHPARVCELRALIWRPPIFWSHARHNVLWPHWEQYLVVLSLYGIWATRRSALLEMQRLELEHLAHMGKMAAVLAHEIRNPLGTIKGFAQLVGEKTDASVRPLLEPILSETGRLRVRPDLLPRGSCAFGAWRSGKKR
jgi:signal transduction histidine kinase